MIAAALAVACLWELSAEEQEVGASCAAQFTIRRSARHFAGRGVVLTEVKTRHARRTIELSPKAIRVLRRHRREQNRTRLRLGPVWRNHDLVFPSRTGTPWEPHNFWRAFKRIARRAEVDRPQEISPHTLRHTAATIWIQAGEDLHTISRRLGHSSAAFTMDRYGHLLPGMQTKAAAALDHLLS